jgi:dipeptidase E
MEGKSHEKLKLILSGGGNEQQSFPLDSFFLSLIPNKGKILYIPIALRGHRFFAGAPEWFQEILKSHNRKDISNDVFLDFSKDVDLGIYDAIYIGGGNTWLLIHEMRQDGFISKLKEYALSGGLVYGGSAGAIILGQDISNSPDKNNMNISDGGGLDLLEGYCVVPHINKKDHKNQPPYAKYIAIPEDGGVFVTGGTISNFFGNVELIEDGCIRTIEKQTDLGEVC